MGKPKIVDLEVCEDGSYGTKESKPKAVVKAEKHTKPKHTVPYAVPTGVDEFLSGVDVGLDLLDAVKIRAIRILGLRD